MVYIRNSSVKELEERGLHSRHRIMAIGYSFSLDDAINRFGEGNFSGVVAKHEDMTIGGPGLNHGHAITVISLQ